MVLIIFVGLLVFTLFDPLVGSLIVVLGLLYL
jgi:hypothetical protein